MEDKKFKIEQVMEHLVKFKDDADGFLQVFKFYSFVYFGGSFALFTYPGAKEKMDKELNKVFDTLYNEKVAVTDKGYDTFVDAFGGACNSTLVLLEQLKMNGCKNFVFNDINKTIYNTHKICKEQPELMIREFSEIVRTRIIQRFGTTLLTRKQFIKLRTQLVREFEDLEASGDYSYRIATRFIFLRESSFSGTLEFYKKSGNIKFDGKIYDDYRFENSFFRMIPKILKFNKIYNDINLRIYNMDAFKLLELEEFKNNHHCLINLDPPYFKQEDIVYTIEELEKLENENLKGCKISYNQPNFPHLDVINLFPKCNFIYNNNSHQILDYYNKKFGVKSEPFNRKEKMTASKDKKTQIVQETISFHNSLLNNL